MVTKARAAVDRYRAAHPDRVKATYKRWAAANPDKVELNRRKQQLKKYGITPEQFDAMLKKQRGKCAVCRCKEPGGIGHWHVDHCHKTKKVRGLLCHLCNTGLGCLGDSRVRLVQAIAYLDGACEL